MLYIELQRKAAIYDARTRAADNLKRRRDEQREDYYRQQCYIQYAEVLYSICV